MSGNPRPATGKGDVSSQHSCKHPLLPPHALPTPTQNKELIEWLRSSSIPLDSSRYESVISSSTAALAQYDSEIQRLQERLQVTLADRTKLKKYVDGWKSTVSPVRRLPPEILCKIFASFSSPTEYPSDSKGELHNLAKSELLQISHVCVRWRSIVMDTPGLWSDITVHAYRWTQESDRFMQLLKLCLERGARHPLILSVHSGTLSSVQAQALFELLAEHSDRWERVSFLMAVDELKPFRPVDRGLDSLRSLSLELISVTEWEMADIGNVDIFEDAPKLQHVHLSTYDVPFCPKLPWRQLRTFTYQGVYVTDLAPLMAFIGNLSHPDAAFELRGFSPERLDSIPLFPQSDLPSPPYLSFWTHIRIHIINLPRLLAKS
ncbi:hypothetical protein B0H13DRAFT_2265981 [Mycena leptocephala]|nr:hypothetical protein B0H13DRAFT_2265981 [Mycena leptocephala]